MLTNTRVIHFDRWSGCDPAGIVFYRAIPNGSTPLIRLFGEGDGDDKNPLPGTTMAPACQRCWKRALTFKVASRYSDDIEI
jgi:hypothetical protein